MDEKSLAVFLTGNIVFVTLALQHIEKVSDVSPLNYVIIRVRVGVSNPIEFVQLDQENEPVIRTVQFPKSSIF